MWYVLSDTLHTNWLVRCEPVYVFSVLLVSLWEPWSNLSMRPMCVIIQTQLALYFFREDASESKYLGLGSSIDQRNSGVRCTGNISENWYDIYIICHDPPAQLKASLHSEAKSIKNRKNVLFESYLLPPNAADMRCCLWWCGKNVHVYAFFRSRGRVHGIDEFCPQRSPVASRSDEGEVSSRAKYGSNKLTKGYQGILVGIALQLRWQY